MRLLIITQKVNENDDVLGFFIGWIREFAKHFEKVIIVCLKAGEYHLPSNVKVLSLGKERGLGKISYLFNFYKYVIGERKNYDAAFVHMNPKYVLLGWPIWKILGKTISLWYAHGHVTPMLRIVDRLADIAFASTKEGYRLNSAKLKIVGQGIDTELFKPRMSNKGPGDELLIVSAGRITPSKDYETLIKATEVLKKDNANFQIAIAGQPATEKDFLYFEELKQMIKEKKMESTFWFIGPIANKNLPPFLQSADLFVNMGHTGSLDKAVLEAMACGLLLLTCNEAFGDVLGSYRDQLMYPKKDFQMLAGKIKYLIHLSEEEREKITRDLRETVVYHHNLKGLITKITSILNG